jgi:hypothetical protein
MQSTLRPLSETARVYHHVCVIARELELLKTHLETLVAKEQETAPLPERVLIDPRTRKPWRTRSKGGAR